jgi:DNA-binding transcriptional LysR family regulator
MPLELRNIDLNLLPVFEAVYEERTLARAGTRLATTQVALLQALERLRAACGGDKLFVRDARGTAPTPLAQAIYAELRPALGRLRAALKTSRPFDASTSKRSFVIANAHPLGPLFAAELRARLKASAPGLFVRFTTRSRPLALPQDVRSAKVDMAVDWLPLEGNEFRHRFLFNDRLVAVARDGHPALAEPASRAHLLAQSFVHLRLRQDPDDLLPGMQPWRAVLDRELTRGDGFTVSELLEVFMVAARSNLFGIIPQSMLGTAEEWFHLRPYGWKPRTKAVAINLWWPASRDNDPAHAFVRAELAKAVADVLVCEAPAQRAPSPRGDRT